MNNFSRRTITGALLVIVVMAGIWLSPVSCLLLGAILLVGGLFEYYKLVSGQISSPQKVNGIITALSVYTVSIFVAADRIGPSYYLIPLSLFLLILIIELFRKSRNPFNNIAHTILGIIFISLPFSLFPFITFIFSGPDPTFPMGIDGFSPGILTGIIILSWVFDTAAYIFGSWIGKNKLMERISPEKSWEGFITGLIASVVIAWPVGLLTGSPGITDWLIIGIIIPVTGTLGDLIESMLKRSVEVKDSGSVLPGHGGILDRFDSLILSLPFVFIYVFLFG